MTKQKTVYFGAGWFTETQNKAYKDAMSALNANPTIDLEKQLCSTSKSIQRHSC